MPSDGVFTVSLAGWDRRTPHETRSAAMAEYVQIQCVSKRPRQDPHQRISHVGGVNPNGTRWKLGEDEAIAGIRQDKWSFYVHTGGARVDVIIATHNGNPYLKTRADGLQPDNLLALPECP
jgi:hypothetical protein